MSAEEGVHLHIRKTNGQIAVYCDCWRTNPKALGPGMLWGKKDDPSFLACANCDRVLGEEEQPIGFLPQGLQPAKKTEGPLSPQKENLPLPPPLTMEEEARLEAIRIKRADLDRQSYELFLELWPLLDKKMDHAIAVGKRRR